MKITAIVLRKGGHPRKGRGFSREELKKADMDRAKALRLGILVDLRRTTLHEENVEKLREYLKTVEKPKSKTE